MLTLSTCTKLFAIALTGIGILQLIFQQVLIGRPAPVITDTTVITGLAILSAIALFVGSLQLWREHPNQALFLTLSVFVFCYAGLTNLFIILSQPDFGFVLTSFGKALTFGSAILLFANITAHRNNAWPYTLCRISIGLFLIIGGVQHFLFADYVKFLVPRWIPFDLFWTYAAAVALIGSGLGLALNIRLRFFAQAAGWMVFTWLLVLHIPRAIVAPNANELAAVCEALAVSMILLTLSRIPQEGQQISQHRDRNQQARDNRT